MTQDKDLLQQAKIVFSDALEKLPSQVDRVCFVKQRCADDPQLRDQVLQLLEAHDDMTDFMNERAFEAVGLLAAESAPSDCVAGKTIGPYKIRELLGEGGMGSVFVAEQTRPVRRQVALKIMKSGLEGRDALARFEAEKQALALMDHPNIAQVLDAGTTESGVPFFVMELVKGISITEYCDQHKLSITERLSLFQSVCQAVQHAHQKSIIHRDLKPSNVLVATYNGTPVPKVIDFGIAKLAHGQRLGAQSLYTAAWQVLGTPLYMSPEQASLNAIDIDTRSDVYSLGVLLYELLTGTTPFDKETLLNAGLEEMRRIIREVEPMRPSKRISTLNLSKRTTALTQRSTNPALHQKLNGSELDWIVMKCLEKDRTRRYESASGLAEDIQRYLKNEQVVACPPSFNYRLKKTFRRNRAWLIPACLILSVLVLATAVSIDQARRARQASAIANLNFENAKLESERARQGLKIALASIDEIVNAIVTDLVKELPQVNASQSKLLRNAVSGYSQIIDLFPSQADVYRKRASVHFQLALYDEAEADYRRVLALAPEDHGAIFWLARIKSKYNYDVNEALQLIDRAIALEPNNADYKSERASIIGKKDTKSALAILNAIIDTQPVYSAYRHRGDIYQKLGRFEDAAADGRMAIKVRPDAQTGYTILASALAEMGRYDEALEACDAGIRSRPQIYWAHRYKGDVLMRVGRFEDACAAYIAALNCVPDQNVVHLRLAVAYSAIGDFDNVKAHLALAENGSGPKPGGVFLGQSVKYSRGTRRSFELIQAYCRRRIAENQGNSEKALAMNAIARGIVETDGATEDALNYAHELAVAAAELLPESSAITNTLGVVQVRLGEYQSAIESFDASSRLSEENRDYNRLWKAIAWFKLGDKAKAVECYRHVEDHTNYPALEREVQKLLGSALEDGETTRSCRPRRDNRLPEMHPIDEPF